MVFRDDPTDVANRLEKLGWTFDELMEIVHAMVRARNDCTENDPIGAPGYMAWKTGTRRLREIGRPKGLEKDETDQIPSAVDPKRGLKFTVSNTDDGTSLKDRIPQNNNRKGPGLDRIVKKNQETLFDYMDAPYKVIPLSTAKKQPGIIQCWHLCVYNEVDDVRAELSCPVGVEGGYFVDFIERIVLCGPGGPGPKVSRMRPGDDSDFDIPVYRKR
jgi:hypothetical protein